MQALLGGTGQVAEEERRGADETVQGHGHCEELETELREFGLFLGQMEAEKETGQTNGVDDNVQSHVDSLVKQRHFLTRLLWGRLGQ